MQLQGQLPAGYLGYGLTLFSPLLLLLIGIAIGLSLHDQQKLLIITGFLGSFTTFSSLSAELSEKLLTGKWLEFSLTLGLHLVGGILLTVMGIILTRMVVSG